MTAIVTLDIEVRIKWYKTDVLPILLFVRPLWQQQDIYMKVIPGGLMNHIIGCRLQKDVQEDDMVLIKIYGPDTSYVNRDNEILTMRVLHHVGCGEPVYCRFTNGMAYRYNPGLCLTPETIQQEHIARCVAKGMARFKASTINWKQVLTEIGEEAKEKEFLAPKSITDDYLNIFLNQIPAKQYDAEIEKRLVNSALDKVNLLREASELQKLLGATSYSSICLSHLDPNPQNIIYDEVNECVKFIDWEYSGLYPVAVDIGAFFVRLGASNGFNKDKIPSKEYQLKWIRWFVEYKFEFEGKDPQSVTQTEVDELFVEENKMSLLSLFVGVLWSIGQIGKSHEIDFIKFAHDWMRVYQARKAYVLST